MRWEVLQGFDCSEDEQAGERTCCRGQGRSFHEMPSKPRIVRLLRQGVWLPGERLPVEQVNERATANVLYVCRRMGDVW
jgi:hypothetical protein